MVLFYPPIKRIKEINSIEPYKSIGPWSLADFRQVKDWREIEYNLHYTFRSSLNTAIKKQKELFHISIQEVKEKLNNINPDKIIHKPKIDRMFQDDDFLNYITELFIFSGLINWLNFQGGWTFVLFPGTFDIVRQFLKLEGVRRGLIAYWSEALIRLKEKEQMSVYARFHNWNAVARINQKIENMG